MMSLLKIFAELDPVRPRGLPQTAANGATIDQIISIFLGLLGALAFLMIVISGLRYILAGGDLQKTAKAKNGIIYALVGLALAIFAQSIVYFVVRRV